MGWFKDWLMKQTNDNPVEVQPSRPWQEPPIMPECKPPKSGMSEPVKTLIAELKKDVWEIKEMYEYGTTWVELIHIYKEDVTLVVSARSRSYPSYDITYNVMVDWMTDLEKMTVDFYATEVIKGLNVIRERARLEGNRKEFAIKLGVVNERK